MTTFLTSTLGFPRMGPNREFKFALEKFWKGACTEQELLTVAHQVEEQAWKLQQEAGINRISVGDHYLYDMVLTWTESLGLCPKRFQHLDAGLKRFFAMARGIDGAEALSMKKWITSNYHYMVPELDETTVIKPDFTSFLDNVKRGLAFLGNETATPVVLGPVSLVHFTKIFSFGTEEQLLKSLLPYYQELFRTLKALGVSEVQIHEPALVFAEKNLTPLLDMAYPCIIANSGLVVNMVSGMDDIGDANYQWIIRQCDIDIISLDFTRGHTLDLIKKYGFPADKTLGVGLIDSRTVWKVVPSSVLEIFRQIEAEGISSLRVQPSGSLQYVPWDLDCEVDLANHPATQVLSFAKQKLSEIKLLGMVVTATTNGDKAGLLQGHEQAWANFKTKVGKEFHQKWTDKDFARSEPFEHRRHKQLKGVPILPTTTIGSFPQTAEIRRLRSQWNKGILTKQQYEAEIDKQIAYMIGVQEALGLDILVHGEPERTDMVEFFAQQMEGMLFTSNGWVQSFGSRCVRPPIFWKDITRPHPMTVREYKVAQALTKKPVKGMLTGPITILNWSFPRIDISRKEQAFQLAYAIRQEVKDLEDAGCTVIQVDEPALREGMPLRAADKDAYLEWAVDAFCLSTGGAKSETQIHTHMCYCEFKDCMHAIDRMDTDVNSIENARNGNETLEAFVAINYTKGFGPGVYDIHSPVVLPVDVMETKIHSFLSCLTPDKVVVNPDCGLKTRNWPETIAALKNMVEATHNVRAQLSL